MVSTGVAWWRKESSINSLGCLRCLCGPCGDFPPKQRNFHGWTATLHLKCWNVQHPPICTMDFPNCCSGGATFTACMLAQKVYIVHVFYSYTNTLHAVTSLCLCVCGWVGVCVCACRYHLTHECTWNTWKFCIFFPFCFGQMAEFPASRGVEPFLGAALDQPWGCGKWKYGCCLLQHLQPIPRRWIYITYRILQRVYSVFVHQKKTKRIKWRSEICIDCIDMHYQSTWAEGPARPGRVSLFAKAACRQSYDPKRKA